MKKSYLYFIVPLVGLIVFGAFYWNFSANYEKQLEAKVVAEKKVKSDKLLLEAKNREKAIADAVAGAARRKAEREAKETRDREEHDKRVAAVESRDKARADQDKFQKQVDRFEKEIKAEKDLIAKLEEEKKRHVEEESFLREYVKKAEANEKGILAVLEKIDAADRAAEAAARAAAEALKAAAKK